MIKVLELIDGGFLGGGQTHILTICRNLNKNVFNPIVAANPDGVFREMVLEAGLKFEGIYLPKIYRSKYLKDLHKIVVDNEIDVVHAHGGVAGMYAKFLKKKHPEVKVIHSVHGIHYINSHNIIRKYVSLFIEQYLVNYADVYLCASEADIIKGTENKVIDRSKTVKIPYGIDLRRFQYKGKNASNMKDFGLTESDFVLGNISRFDEQKNQQMIIESFPEILKSIPNAKLLLIGEGDLLEFNKRLANKLNVSDKIIFGGTRRDLENIYPLIDVFIFPSKWEGLSITIMEALASGRCLAVSNIPQNTEMITNDLDGKVFALESKAELINTVIKLHNNPEMRMRLSVNAQKRSATYDEKVMTEKMEQVYLKLKQTK